MDFELVGDMKFFYEAKTAETLGPADIKVDGFALARETAFETSIVISLFTDARADSGDDLPSTYKFKSGYFGSELTKFNIGSRLWTLGRSKITPSTISESVQYIKDALAWMIIDEIADGVEAKGKRTGARQIDFAVKITRRNADNVFFSFFVNWENQTFGGLSI
jgi:phage gp46-like protein